MQLVVVAHLRQSSGRVSAFEQRGVVQYAAAHRHLSPPDGRHGVRRAASTDHCGRTQQRAGETGGPAAAAGRERTARGDAVVVAD